MVVWEAVDPEQYRRKRSKLRGTAGKEGCQSLGKRREWKPGETVY
jgi:hypothetical protein